MKKRIIALSSLVALGVVAAAGAFGATNVVKAEEVDVPNLAENWKPIGENTTSATDVTGGVQITGSGNWKVGAYNDSLVPLDGLSMTVNNVDGANCSALSIFFSPTGDSDTWTGACISLWHDPYACGQARIHVGGSHNYNEPSLAYTSKDFTSSGFGVASSCVMNKKDTDGFKFSIDRLTRTCWQLKIYQIYDNTLWNNNANYNAEELSTTVYIPHDTIAPSLNADGKCYIHASGISASNNVIEITGVKSNPQYVPSEVYTKAEFQAEMDKIKDEYIASFTKFPTYRTQLEDEKAAAVSALAAAPDSGTLDKYQTVNDFINKWKNNRYDIYGYQEGVLEIEEGVSWAKGSKGGAGAQKIANNGVQLTVQSTWQCRMPCTSLLSATEFEMDFNLAKVDVNVAMPITFSPQDNPDSYPTEPGHIFHLEILKYEENSYLVIIGNTSAHNVSIEEWGTEAAGAGFTGRKVLNNCSGDFNIKFTTDYENGTTRVNVNDGMLDYTFQDNSTLYGENPTAPIPAVASWGSMNGSDYQNFIVYKFSSPENYNKSFDNGSADGVVILKAEVGTKANLGSITCDGNAIPEAAYEFGSENITLITKYLNTLTVGTHSIVVTPVSGEAHTWTLTVNANSNPDYPYAAKKKYTIQQAEIADLVIDIDINGAQLSEIVVKLEDAVMSASSYEWSNFNTKFTVKAAALSAMGVGEHHIYMSRNGVEGELKITITIENGSSTTTSIAPSTTSQGGGGAKKGCGGAVIGSIIGVTAMVTLLGGVLLAKKKETK